jgi:hypothetical protein
MHSQKPVVATICIAVAACLGGEPQVKAVPPEEPANPVMITPPELLTPAVLTPAAARAKNRGDRVTVYISPGASVDLMVLAQAKNLASRMFAGIGVDIEWLQGRPSVREKGAIGIEFVTNTPESLRPGSLACARPYEGVHVLVLWDRIHRLPSANRVLAHVMVHEITHLLEGVEGHSEEGVMKAHWSDADFGSMRRKTLPFAPEDVSLIHRGLRSRTSIAMATAVRAENTLGAVLGAGK